MPAARRGSRVAVASPERSGVVAVECRAGPAVARAHVTFTGALDPPVADPYAGGAVLFKARRTPPELAGPGGAAVTGLEDLDAALARFGAWALPAFPFDRRGASDRAGLRRWIAVVIPEGVNFYEALERLRASPDLGAQSYTPSGLTLVRTWERAAVLRPLVPPSQDAAARAADGEARVQVALVGSGVDARASAIADALRRKLDEYQGSESDGDGNGVPGDEIGADLAGLAVVMEPGAPPYFALRDESAPPGDDARAARALAVEPGARLIPVAVGADAWSRAAGVVYAALEGADVVACASADTGGSWLLHDALLFVEDNCAIPACGGTRDLVDPWSGARERDFQPRPVRAADLGLEAAVERAAEPERRACARVGATAGRPLWRRARMKVGYGGPGDVHGGVGPASRERRDGLDRIPGEER